MKRITKGVLGIYRAALLGFVAIIWEVVSGDELGMWVYIVIGTVAGFSTNVFSDE